MPRDPKDILALTVSGVAGLIAVTALVLPYRRRSREKIDGVPARH
jgi:hypothetical protein